ncbi:hypothetical protein H6F88_31785 [Oculatella sp. FACHB-28]|uniref:hypothetical protein n=1 Tax=Oculatella sp. FACHB-28 TaxID=2692845 RepID=UPI001684E0F6|nr:hypothetical protein [Oculatella sp. FACHB-28]MBD2060525.1 hypothetical protein [Oculatella sp. FACHB-28]
MTQPSPQSTPPQNTHPAAVQRSQEAPIPIQSISTNAQRDIYVVARDSVITSPLAVLITLIVTGIGLALLFQRLTRNITPLLTKYVEAQVNFLEDAGDQIKSTNETVDEMTDKADKHYTDTSLHSVLVIEKLNRIEAEIKDVKQTIVNCNK